MNTEELLEFLYVQLLLLDGISLTFIIVVRFTLRYQKQVTGRHPKKIGRVESENDSRSSVVVPSKFLLAIVSKGCCLISSRRGAVKSKKRVSFGNQELSIIVVHYILFVLALSYKYGYYRTVSCPFN